MKQKNNGRDLSRRDLLKLSAGLSGAAALGALAPMPSIFNPTAQAQEGKRSAVLVVFLEGGYNAIFTSANSFSGSGAFSVSDNNVLNLGNGLVVDRSLSVLSNFTKSHMATVGVRHGVSDHGGAPRVQFTVQNQNPLMMLAAAMGGNGSIKCANVGGEFAPGPKRAVSGVSLQQIVDMQSTIDALGGGVKDPTMPDRAFAAKGILSAQNMSGQRLQGNPESLESVKDGYQAAFETLIKPAKPFDPKELLRAYNLNGTSVRSMAAKFAAAELMIRSGTNVVSALSRNWDTHGDRSGNIARRMFNDQILPGLKVFTDRMVNEENNVTVIVLGDFARSLPGSDHASVTSATIIGPNVKVGTTGKVSESVGLPGGSPSVDGMWGLISALANAPAAVQMFGGNPHKIISAV